MTNQDWAFAENLWASRPPGGRLLPHPWGVSNSGSPGESVSVTPLQGQGIKHVTHWKEVGVGGPPSGRWGGGGIAARGSGC
jgi:hypothetical protein